MHQQDHPPLNIDCDWRSLAWGLADGWSGNRAGRCGIPAIYQPGRREQRVTPRHQERGSDVPPREIRRVRNQSLHNFPLRGFTEVTRVVFTAGGPWIQLFIENGFWGRVVLYTLDDVSVWPATIVENTHSVKSTVTLHPSNRHFFFNQSLVWPAFGFRYEKVSHVWRS